MSGISIVLTSLYPSVHKQFDKYMQTKNDDHTIHDTIHDTMKVADHDNNTDHRVTQTLQTIQKIETDKRTELMNEIIFLSSFD